MSIELVTQRVTALQAIEARMGDVAALLSEMADVLTSHPDGVIIRGATHALPPSARVRMDAIEIWAREWPSADDLQRLLSEWHAEVIKARQAWEGLPVDLQAMIQPPGEGGPDPNRPMW